MSLKRRLFYSFLMAIALTATSLLYHTGQANYEPMPVGNPKYPPGATVCPIEVCQADALSSRGWPLQIVAITPDYDTESNLYDNVLVVALLGDLALYFVLSFGALWLVERTKNASAKRKRGAK